MTFQRRVLTPEEMRGLAGGVVKKGNVYKSKPGSGQGGCYVDVIEPEHYNKIEDAYIIYDNDTNEAVFYANNEEEALRFDAAYNTQGNKLYKVNPLSVSYGPKHGGISGWKTLEPLSQDDYDYYL